MKWLGFALVIDKQYLSVCSMVTTATSTTSSITFFALFEHQVAPSNTRGPIRTDLKSP